MRHFLAAVCALVCLAGCGKAAKDGGQTSDLAGGEVLSEVADGGGEVDVCVPSCPVGCGYDGCGNLCPPGCDDGDPCTIDQCLFDGCHYVADPACCLIKGSTYPNGSESPEDPCRICSMVADPLAWTLLDDGTTCGPNHVCLDGSCCDWGESCAGRECGPGACGACGICPAAAPICLDGTCCAYDCTGLQCGTDDCGHACGPCPAWTECLDSQLCATACLLACEGKECGDDGCGGTCGKCPPGGSCDGEGQCLFDCSLDCTGKECGSDGCGGSCGTCQEGETCHDGACVEGCAADCELRQCGKDGCGGECGACDEGINCTESFLCGGFCTDCEARPSFCDSVEFGEGSLAQWTVSPGATLVESLVEGYPALTAGFMLKLEPSLEVGTEVWAEHQTCLSAGQHEVLIGWRFNSAEMDNWCNTEFGEDGFKITVSYGGSEAVVLFETSANRLCDPIPCSECGQDFVGLDESPYPKGEAAMITPWVEMTEPINVPAGGELVTVRFEVWEVNAYNFPTLLVDRLGFDGHGACDHSCLGNQCGDNGCGESCGTCADHEVCNGQVCECEWLECGGVCCKHWNDICLEGICCKPNCTGKQCGDNGCDGVCGTCVEGQVCVDGLCQNE